MKTLILLALGALFVLPACTTNGSFVRTEKVTAFTFHNSFLRRDVHTDTVNVESETALDMTVAGESKAVSGQAALTGTAIGAALAGPGGAAVGGTAGIASEIAADMATENIGDETETTDAE